MPSRSSKPKKPKRDFSQVAFDVVARLTGGKPNEQPKGIKAALDDKELRKALMREMGSRGGSVGGRKRAESLSSERRSEIAREAAQKRWNHGRE